MQQQTKTLKIAFTTCAAFLISITPAFCSDTTEKNSSGLQTPEPVTAMEHNNRAVELGSKGRWELAIKEHETALQLHEQTAKAQIQPKTTSHDVYRMNLSGACLRFGDRLAQEKKYDEAKKIYQKALDADSNNHPARARLQRILEMETGKATSEKTPATSDKTPNTSGKTQDLPAPVQKTPSVDGTKSNQQ
ncbi:MAG: tetratricopeptide repeat protein [Candidatus Melainabacteria bacterium]|nr:tetratricopeptide repeat protein [Candidatus Melainabacteria bacterium]